jgi:hypothetical protein
MIDEESTDGNKGKTRQYDVIGSGDGTGMKYCHTGSIGAYIMCFDKTALLRFEAPYKYGRLNARYDGANMGGTYLPLSIRAHPLSPLHR